MSMNCKYFVALLATALLAGVATDAGAVTITNITTNTVLFSDDFEAVGAGNTSFAGDDGSVDFDPVAAPGTWTIVESDPSQIQVTEFDGTDYPGAAQGDNYLWVNRTGGFNRASGDFTPQVNGAMDAGPNAGDLIRVEFQLYARDFAAGAGPDVFALYSDAGGNTGPRLARLNINGDGNIFQGATDTGVDWISDTWQTWTIDLVLGSGEYDLTVGAGPTVTVGYENAADEASLASLRFGSNTATEYFIDAAGAGVVIPEPSSLLLTGMGLFGIATLVRRRAVS